MMKRPSLWISWPTPFVMEGGLYMMSLIMLCALKLASKLTVHDSNDNNSNSNQCAYESASLPTCSNHLVPWTCWCWTLLLFVFMLSNFYHHHHKMKRTKTNPTTVADADGMWMGMTLLPLMILSLIPTIDDSSNEMMIVTSCVFYVFCTFQKPGHTFHLFLLLFWVTVPSSKVFNMDDWLYVFPQYASYKEQPFSSSPKQKQQNFIKITYYTLWLGGTFWYYIYIHYPQSKYKVKHRPFMTFGEWNILWSLWCWISSDWITNTLLQTPRQREDTVPLLLEGKNSLHNSHSYLFLVIQASMVGCGFGSILFGFLINITSRILNRNKNPSSSTAGKDMKRKFLSSLNMFLFLICMIFILWFTVTVTLTNHNYHDNLFYRHFDNDGYPYFLLIPIIWIYSFLTNENINGTDDANEIPYIGTIFLYWLLVLTCFVIPVSIQFIIPNNDQNQKKKKVEKPKNYTTVKRKFYHFVVILLFGTPTYVSPKLMSLVYAAAIVLLIFMESIRMIQIVPALSTNNHDHQNSCTKKKRNIWDFYRALLDKDKDNEDTIITSHVLLILGCAIPLWIHQLLILRHDHLTNYDKNHFNFNNDLLPYCGILVLGIGDAAGACVGTYYGNYVWFAPSVKWKRTLEGSLAMFLSMELSLIAFLWSMHEDRWNYYDLLYISLFVLLPLTLFEACTIQIDNLCLPLIATWTTYIQTESWR